MDAGHTDGNDSSPHSPPPTADDDTRGSYGGEALIIGDASGDFEAMLSDATGAFALDGVPRILEPAPVYIASNVQEMMQAAAVLQLKEGAKPHALLLSPGEKKVVGLIDGERPVARIRKKT